MGIKVIELTKENYEKYIDQIANLEVKVLNNMEKNGKKGQLFITGKEDILEYIFSKENTVMCAINEDNKVISASYITQGQKPYTYNDITKYFKSGKNYNEYVKKIYGYPKYQFKILEMYALKLKAFEKAKKDVLSEYPEFKNINEFLDHELKSETHFDEKSALREKINEKMSEIIEQEGKTEEYENFYWTNSTDVCDALCKDLKKEKIKNTNILEYDRFLENSKLEIHGKTLQEETKYYKANTSNSIEIDTYITDPENRHSGLARILVYEGIKNKIIENFEKTKNNEIYLCSTLHEKNLSSKYVSEFFGLKDNVFVKRRANRDREVHICKIEKENYKKYLNNMEDKLIVLYGYNPSKKKLSTKRQIEILNEQLEYEHMQYTRLNKIRHGNKDYTGKLTEIMPKLEKIGRLKQKIKSLKQKQQEGQEK